MKVLTVLVMALGLLVAGCGLLDSLMGVQHNPDGSVTVQPGGGVVGGVGKVAGGIPGWPGLVGTGLGLLATLYQSIRVRNYKQGFQAVVTGVDTALAQGTKTQVTKDELYAALKAQVEEYATNPQKITDLIAAVKAVERSG